MNRPPPNSRHGCSWIAALILLVLIAALGYYGIVHHGVVPEDPETAFPDRMPDPGPAPAPVPR